MVNVNEERMKLRRVVESRFGTLLNNGWVMSMTKRTWTQHGVPITRVVNLWNYRSEILLKIRRFYEESIRHRGKGFHILPTLGQQRGDGLVDPNTGSAFELDYTWLVLVQYDMMPLADALRIVSEE